MIRILFGSLPSAVVVLQGKYGFFISPVFINGTACAPEHPFLAG
jgi:hypothetical protein